MKKLLFSFAIISVFFFFSPLKVNAAATIVTTTGTGSWTIPAGVTSIQVELWGGGGGGASNFQGGGSGAYVVETSQAVTAGNYIYYEIATGGGGGGSSIGTGGSGGTGYFSGGSGAGGSNLSGGGGGGSTAVTIGGTALNTGGTTYIASGGGGGGVGNGIGYAYAASGSSGGAGGPGVSSYYAGGGGGSGTVGGNASGATQGAGGTGGTSCTGTNGYDTDTTASYFGGGSSAGATGNGKNTPSSSVGAAGSGGAAGGTSSGGTGTAGSGSDSGGGGGSGTSGVSGGVGGQPGAGGGGGASGGYTGTGGGTGGAGELIITYTTPVYYSVGQSTADLKSDSPTVTIASGAAVFSVAQSANIGVGDRVTYNTNSIAYIAAKTNTDQMHWTLITATGGVPTNITGSTVVSIKHEYTSLSAAIAGASDASHLNTANLVTGNYILNIPCYYDSGADTTAVTVSGYTTGAANYIKIYTPNNTTTEVNQSQRHSGKWTTTAYSLSSTLGYGNTLSLYQDYTQIDGLQIIGPYSYAVASENTGTQVSNSIINKTNGGTAILFNGISLKYWNNIIYGNGTGTAILSENGNTYYYNNTLANFAIGFDKMCSGDTVKNTIFYNTTTDYQNDGCGSDPSFTYSATNNVSSNMPAGTGNRYAQTFSFVDPTNKDFHLSGNDTGAKDHGVNLSADANLAFSTDIDGDTRSGLWDIGADEYSAPSASCGDGTCNGSETHATCPADCPLTANSDGATIIGAEGGGAKTIINSPLSVPFGNSGLVGYWSFDGANTAWSSATAGTTNDLSGNSNTGTMTNMSRSTSPTPGISGQGLKFDGVDDYVNTGNTFKQTTLSTTKTISTWVKPNATPSGYPLCLIREYGDICVFAFLANGNWEAKYFTWTSATITSSVAVVPGQWAFLTLVQSGSLITLYINGISVGSANDAGVAADVNDVQYIGARHNTNTGAQDIFNGSMDEVRVYNRALSASEVQELYQQGQRRVKIKAD